MAVGQNSAEPDSFPNNVQRLTVAFFCCPDSFLVNRYAVSLSLAWPTSIANIVTMLT